MRPCHAITPGDSLGEAAKPRFPNAHLRPLATAALLAAVLLTLQGCFEMEQRVALNKDGGMEFTVQYAIPSRYLEFLSQFHAQLGLWQDNRDGDTSWLLNRDAVERQFADSPIQVTEYNSFTRSGTVHVRVRGKAEDAAVALAGGQLGKLALVADEAGGMRELVLSLPEEVQYPELEAGQREALKLAAKGLSVVLVLETPTRVVETNGEKTGRREVTWSFGPELAHDPNALPKRLFVKFE
jgi:hypothetical protein